MLKKILTQQYLIFFGVFVNALRILHNNDKMQHETLMKEDGFLWQLFPYIRFLHAIPRPVLLVTTKKLLNGFFDGVSIKHWADLSKNIIFVDEFEHQEEEILKHLCEQPEMNNMFEFVRQFMTKVKELTETHKSVVKARKVLEKFIKELERLEYLEIYDFMMAPGLFDKNKLSILQSRRLTSTSNFLITPEGKSWRIVKNDAPNAMRSRPLLYLFDRTSKGILTFFYNLYRNSKTPHVFNHWVESVFNVHNDNMAGKYSSIISIHAQIPPLQEYHWKKTFDNQMVLESSYFKGMGMYSLERTNYIPAPDDVKVTQYNLFASLGVNLEWCKPDDPTKLDFEGLHILNPFMFYFEVEKSDFKHSHTSNFWKLNKLRESARISDQQFELILKQLRPTNDQISSHSIIKRLLF